MREQEGGRSGEGPPAPGPVPVLMLHDVTPPGMSPKDPYSLDIDELSGLLDDLLALGWTTGSLATLRAPGPEPGLAGDAAGPPARCCLLTFDDAHRGVLQRALPLLAARGMVGTIYAIAGRTGRDPRHLDGEELRALAAAGWTLGTHGDSHRHLTGLDPDEVAAEWRDSRERLEELTGLPVVHGSLPGGRGGERELLAARAAGLLSVATSRPGLWRSPRADFAIPRLVARRSLRGHRLRRALDGAPASLLPARGRYAALGLVQRLLGDPLYDRVRELLTGWRAGARG